MLLPHWRLLLCLLLAMGGPANLHSAGARLFKSGPVQISANGLWVWVANQDNDSVARINTAHPSSPWNVPGAGRLLGSGTNVAEYNGTNDLAARVDATIAVDAVNEQIEFAGPLITDAFRFWFTNPGVDYGYAFRVLGNSTHELKCTSNEKGLGERGPVLQITYLLPAAPRIAGAAIFPGGVIELAVECQPGRNYDLESSANLQTWDLLMPFLGTNANMRVQDSAGPAAGQRFYRLLAR